MSTAIVAGSGSPLTMALGHWHGFRHFYSVSYILTREKHCGEPALLHRVVRKELQSQRVALRRDDGRQPRPAEETVLPHLPGAHLGAQRQAVIFAILFSDIHWVLI